MALGRFNVPLPRRTPFDPAKLAEALSAPAVAREQRTANVFGTVAGLPAQYLKEKQAQEESALKKKLTEAQIGEIKARALRYEKVSSTAQKEPSIFRQAVLNVVKNPLYQVSSPEEKTALLEQEIEVLRQASESARGVKRPLPQAPGITKPKPTARSVLDKYKVK